MAARLCSTRRCQLLIALGLSAAVGVAGCASILGVDEFESYQGAGGAAGSSSGTGGGSSGSEGCLDKVDNNGDGLADCEDPLCQDDPYPVGLRLLGTAVTSNGSCTPAGTSQLIGQLAPAGLITVCCVGPSG